MNVILDIIVVIIAALSIIVAAKRGFFRTLLSGTAFLLSLILTIALVAPVRNALIQTPIYDSAKEGITAWINDTAMHAIQNAEDGASDSLQKATTDNADFASILDSLGIDIDSIKDEIMNYSDDGVEASVKAFAENIGEKVAMALVSFVAALLLFIVLYIIIQLISKFLESVIKKFPVLKVADGVLGSVLGAIFGLVRIFAFVSLMHLVIPYLQASSNEFVSAVEPTKTLIFSVFYNINFFAFLF